ncbi:unnamed protein product [Pleuronectes platessa]|uniref:G-protein coupled receptors family 1 profile domain-containing protein n=1 Tax=Pleuronectes platessa TaxID=8262 RepID=A0A9N7USZ0_PLEPL|nr:unnamed protein product [Pleuronectes platessa]
MSPEVIVVGGVEQQGGAYVNRNHLKDSHFSPSTVSVTTSRAQMPNATSGGLFCPLLQDMRNHSLNNNSQVNMVVVCFHGLVSCLGLLENALILWVLGFRLQHHTVTSIWVLNLALSDFLATLSLPLFASYYYHLHSWELGNALCKTQASIFFINMFVSAFLLAAISLDRLLLVVKPVWSQNHRAVSGAWKVCGLATLERDCEVRQAATAVSKLLLAFLFPLVVIAGSYVQIGLSLRSRSRRRKQSTTRLTDALIMSNKGMASGATDTTTNIILKPPSSSPTLASTPASMSTTISNQTNRGQLSQSFIKMVTFVITAFVLCWAPYHIFCIIELTAHYWRKNLKVVELGLPLATTIAFLNPVLNPILYAFSCPHFCVKIRQSLGAVFDGLVEEDGGFLVAQGKSIRAQIRRKSSRDVSPATPGSSSPCTSPVIRHAFPQPLDS